MTLLRLKIDMAPYPVFEPPRVPEEHGGLVR